MKTRNEKSQPNGGSPTPGRGQAAIPRGIEVLVKKAAVDEAFRGVLLARRGEAAAGIGLELDPAERTMLSSISEEHLARIIGQTMVPAEQQRVFLGHVAAAMLAVLGVGLATSQPSQAASNARIKPGSVNAPSPGEMPGNLYWIGGPSAGAGPFIDVQDLRDDARPMIIAGAVAMPEEVKPLEGPIYELPPDHSPPPTPASGTPSSRPAAAPPTPPTLDWKDPAAAQKLVQDLSDNRYEVRERGQQVLDAIPANQHEKVRALAENVADLEAKARLTARAELMVVLNALQPPPISLDVNNATLDEVAEALTKAMGLPIPANTPPAGFGNERYTISAQSKSFSEIIKNAPLWPATAQGQWKLDRLDWGEKQSAGGVCIAINGPRQPTPAALNAVSVGMSASMSLAVDPRITVVEIRAPEITSATDQAGHPLAIRASGTSASYAKSAGENHLWVNSINWNQPRDDAATVTSMSVTGRWPLIVSVPDPTSKTGGTKNVTVMVPFDFRQLPVH